MRRTGEHPIVSSHAAQGRRIGVAAAAVPAVMIRLAMPANAAELSPIAEVVERTVADTASIVGVVLDAARLAA